MAARRLWAARLAWFFLALTAVGFLAVSTPGNAMDVPARPLLSLVTVVVLVGSYPWLKRRLVQP